MQLLKYFRSGQCSKALKAFTLIILSLSYACTSHHLYQHLTQNRLYALSDTSVSAKDTQIQKLIADYKDSINNAMLGNTCQTLHPLSKALPESSLGNWVCDAILAQLNKQNSQTIDVFILNYNSIHTDLIPAGPIRLKDLYNVLADNSIIQVRVKGSTIYSLCDSIVKLQGIPLAGMTMRIKKNHAYQIKIQGNIVNDEQWYVIALDFSLLYNKRLKAWLEQQTQSACSKRLRILLLQDAYDRQRVNQAIESNLDNRIVYDD